MSSFSDGVENASPGGMLGDPNPNPDDAGSVFQAEEQPAAEFETYDDDLQAAVDFDALPPETQEEIEALAAQQQQEAEFERYQTETAQALAADYPELGANEELAAGLVQEARLQAHQLGRPDLAEDPAWWRQIYESSNGPTHFQHERIADAIVGRQGSRALPFGAGDDGARGGGGSGSTGGGRLGRHALPF